MGELGGLGGGFVCAGAFCFEALLGLIEEGLVEFTEDFVVSLGESLDYLICS